MLWESHALAALDSAISRMQKAQNRPDRFPHVRLRSTSLRPASLSLYSLACILIVLTLPPLPLLRCGALKRNMSRDARIRVPHSEPLVLWKWPARIRSIYGLFSC